MPKGTEQGAQPPILNVVDMDDVGAAPVDQIVEKREGHVAPVGVILGIDEWKPAHQRAALTTPPPLRRPFVHEIADTEARQPLRQVLDDALDTAGRLDLWKALCAEDDHATRRATTPRATAEVRGETSDRAKLARSHANVLRDDRLRDCESMARESVFVNRRGILEECARTAPEVRHLPFFYQLHLNLACNQKCIMCAPEGKHRKEVLPFDDFVALFDQIRGVAEHITLIGGEPLMYPHIDAVLALLAQHDVDVTINTNATMLTPHIITRLLALRTLNLRCSIDGATAETYHQVRGTDVFDRVTANLRRFSAAIAALPHVRLILVYVVMRRNLHEVVPFVDFARALNLERVEFLPVRHVREWQVSNGTGWQFDGRDQSCEHFRDEYNDTMRQAAAACDAAGVNHEVHIL